MFTKINCREKKEKEYAGKSSVNTYLTGKMLRGAFFLLFLLSGVFVGKTAESGELSAPYVGGVYEAGETDSAGYLPKIEKKPSLENSLQKIEAFEMIKSTGKVFWLNFDRYMVELNEIHKKFLSEICKDKLLGDKKMQVNIISYAYANDSYSPRAKEISGIRGEKVKQFLSEKGFAADKIHLFAWGNRVCDDKIYIELVSG